MSVSRRLIPILIALTVWTIWLMALGIHEAFGYIVKHWEISLTMLFGSIIAGATSLGGGAVAFPVFTKVLNINPYDAKIFSLAIQSVGMSAAALAIYSNRIRVERRIILWTSLSGTIGVWLGLDLLAPLLPPDAIKIYFTLILTSLAITLLLVNQGLRRQYNFSIPIWTIREKLILLTVGFLGGIVSGLVGNGIGIFIFAVMVLLFRISEKIATPTSVIIMAINALAGFAYQVFVDQDFTQPVKDYWLAAIPIVVVGAPIGAIICSKLHRQTINRILIGLILTELIASLIIIPLRMIVIYSGIGILLLFSYFNYWMYRTQIYEVDRNRSGVSNGLKQELN